MGSPSCSGTGVQVNLDGIALSHHKLTQQDDSKLTLETGEATPLTPLTMVGSAELHDPTNAHWAEIVDAINELFAGTA